MRVRGSIGLLCAVMLLGAAPASAREIGAEAWVSDGPAANVRGEKLSVPVPNTITAEIETRLLREVTVRFDEGCELAGTLTLDGAPLKGFTIPPKGRKLGLSAKAGVGTHVVGLELRPGADCGRGRAVLETATFREWVPIGSDLGSEYMEGDEPYQDLIAKHADSVTAGTNMQWKAIEPQQGVFDFAGADTVVDFAEEQGLEVRGHPLVWRHFIPNYVKSSQNTAAELAEIMRVHIQTIVSRYRGVVDEWDVVNEPISESGGGLRDVFWRRKLGRNYIAMAFLFAHEADPEAKLFLNEYGAESKDAKSDTLLSTARALLAAGIPLDGVGFQFHATTEGWPDSEKMEENFERFADLGLSIQISEADVADYTDNPDSEHRRQLQRDAFAAAARACKHVVSCERFTMWGLSDRYSWLGVENRPLPFDKDLKAKPAWGSIKEILRPKD